MLTKPIVMVMQALLEPICASLQGEYELVRGWEPVPPERLEAVRAVVVVGDAPLDTERLAQMPLLGLVACFTSGYDGIDVGWARARGLRLSYACGINDDDVADHALGLMLASRRGMVSGDAVVRAGEWSGERKLSTQSMGGQRVGIVGLGRIGRLVAKRCAAFRMEVGWWGPREKPGSAWPRAASLLALAEQSDILVVACRLDQTNVGMISAEVMAALGPKGLLVNVARGALVEEAALVAALRSGMLGGAALDVFAEEPADAAVWADVPNTVLTPHTGGVTEAALGAMQRLLRENLAAYFAGKPLPAPIP